MAANTVWPEGARKSLEILGLPTGTIVPQLVIKETILSRAAPGSDKWIVSEYFSASSPITLTTSSGGRLRSGSINQATMFDEADGILRSLWGEFPKLHSIEPAG